MSRRFVSRFNFVMVLKKDYKNSTYKIWAPLPCQSGIVGCKVKSVLWISKASLTKSSTLLQNSSWFTIQYSYDMCIGYQIILKLDSRCGVLLDVLHQFVLNMLVVETLRVPICSAYNTRANLYTLAACRRSLAIY